MTPAEHYARGLEILSRVDDTADRRGMRWDHVTAMAGLAQAHFLAVLAVEPLAQTQRVDPGSDSETILSWGGGA